jgi:glycosyltransferase involved in cell wall biosynthesis
MLAEKVCMCEMQNAGVGGVTAKKYASQCNKSMNNIQPLMTVLLTVFFASNSSGRMTKKTFVFLIIGAISAFSSVIPAISRQPCMQYGLNQSVLLMDVLWVIQGRQISFSGFFVEFLGISSAFRDFLPFGKLTKSFFNQSLDEEPMINPDKMFNQDLFQKESHTLKYVLSNKHPDIDEFEHFRDFAKPFPKFIQESANASMFCDQAIARWDEGQIMIGGDLSRGVYHNDQNPTTSATDCCLVCSRQPLCVAWTFDSDSNRCSLKSSRTTTFENVPTGMTGHMVGTDPLTGQRTGIAPKPRAIVFHGTTCVAMNMSIYNMARDVNTIYIGRFMFERPHFNHGSTIDERAVTHCAGLMDEIWVPTEWHAKVFHDILSQNFGRVPFITIIPEAVDTELFAPEKGVGSLPSELQLPNDVDLEFTDVAVPVYNKRCAFSTTKLECNLGKFEFLSVFKWEYRKGWDILLTSYWNTFNREDDVVLRIRSYVPSNDKGEPSVTIRMQQFARQHFGKELNELPSVIIETGILAELGSDSLSRTEIRDMLDSADAFVLPTRGEGWGLPIAEAMSMELPVIVTNCTGPKAYANKQNAYLIEIEEDQDQWSFVVPKLVSLQKHLRQVILDSSPESGVAKRKGVKARQTMKEISPTSILCKINDRLRFQAERRGFYFH